MGDVNNATEGQPGTPPEPKPEDVVPPAPVAETPPAEAPPASDPPKSPTASFDGRADLF